MTKLFVLLLFCILMLTVADATRRNRKYNYCESNYPVCATNGTHSFLFKNECRLNWKNAKRQRDGLPPLQIAEITNCFKKCDQVCTEEYAPICATCNATMQTFGNRCQLDLENCKNGNIWQILHEGECPAPPSVTLEPPVKEEPPVTSEPLPPVTELPPVTAPPLPLPTTIEPPCEDEEECPTHCTLEYKPVCGTLGGADETFQNLCYLRADKCSSGRDWQVKYEGECTELEPICEPDCPKIYSPICATYNGENRTFSNECLLDLEVCTTKCQWDYLHRGECRPPPTNCAAILCPNIYQPVCASSKGVTKTFPNKCILGVDECFSGTKWQIICESECPKTSEPLPPNPQLPPKQTQPPVSPTKPCPQFCPAIYDPVCAAFQGQTRTFPSSCELGVTACNTGQNWLVLYRGECVSPNEPEVAVCPANYDPVCAAYNGKTRTFTNKCQMDAEVARTNAVWEIVALGECEKQPPPVVPAGPCPKCSNFYQPVCGFSDGEQKTFTNECQLMGENCYSGRKWVLVYEGECKVSDQPRNCPNTCPVNYDPVCAIYNGVKRTFPNECELNHEAYKTNTQWVILSLGECDYCPVCPDTIDPVCASYNGQAKTFDNACKMEYENCKSGSAWKIVSRSVCEDDNCPKFCAKIYSPVCATNQLETRTFANICEMKIEACRSKTVWTVLKNGECPPPIKECPQACTLQYQPVCAVHKGVSKTFGNECMLRAEICKTKIDWLFLHAGPCFTNEQIPPINPSLGPNYPAETSNPQMVFGVFNHMQTSTNTSPNNMYNFHEDKMSVIVRSKPIATAPTCEVVQCLDISDPICAAYNGQMKTFGNACYFENVKCSKNENWEFLYNGPCLTLPPSTVSGYNKHNLY